jgi:aminoacyl-tRNA hydrolase
MAAVNVRMRQLVDAIVRTVTMGIQRIFPRAPVLDSWPGTARIIASMRSRVVTPVQRAVIWQLADRRRALLTDTTFIGVTGSAGKTITKDMIGTVLGAKYRGSYNRGTLNYEHNTASSIRMARPGDRFHVVELSAGGGPGSLRRPLELLRPSIGVVTNIGTDHYAAFGSLDAIAEEKGRLIRALPAHGVAVLNADDPRVIAMRNNCRARVITFGVSPDADVRAEHVSASWPDRLSLDLLHDGRRANVQTQMCGTQWVSSVLAGAAVGLAMDLQLDEISAALGKVEPFQARMSPLTLPDGVTFIRDDWKASVHTIPPALEFLRTARASRKVALIGTIADTAGDAGTIYVSMARHALEVADLVVFVGPRAFAAMRARPAQNPERLRAFSTVRVAHEFLASFLMAGDLVLLKGSNSADHLYRIALARTMPVSCWRSNCHRQAFCNTCELVTAEESEEEPTRATHDESAVATSSGTVTTLGLAAGSSVLVGLGNPGEKYANTPHNVGYAVLDRIASEGAGTWSESPGALVCHVDWRGIPLCLVKPRTFVNLSGPALSAFFKSAGIEIHQVVLVYDDIDLPLGKVRARLRGSDGGHRGVRSILEAFQTDQIRRVKVGVKRPSEIESAADAVLRPFTVPEHPIVGSAVEEAASRIQGKRPVEAVLTLRS